MTTVILTDIEGTTSSVAFVKDVLFPYARKKIPQYVRAYVQDPEVRAQLDAVIAEEGLAAGDVEAALSALDRWMDQDRKATPLKTLQGWVWEAGYRDGDYRAHMYPDAATQLREWHRDGILVYVYSSGSVLAQKLFFAHSEVGDLTEIFAGHFDTTVGSKKEAASYVKIAERIGVSARDIIFLSDVEAELNAAREAGMRTYHVVRDGQPPSASHPVVHTLTAVTLE